MRFCDKLRELKDASGLSEAKLAEKSGVRLGALHTYILGSRKPSFTAVVKLAKAMGTSCEAFANCEDVIAEESGPAKAGARKPSKRKGR